MTWKKVNVLDCCGRNVFVDKYGFCNLRRINVISKSRNKIISDFSDYYMSDDASGKYYRIGSKSLDLKQLLKLVLSKEIYECKNLNNVGPYGYGYQRIDAINKENAQKVSYGTIELHLRYEKQSFNRNNVYGSSTSCEDVIPINKNSDIDKIEVWYQENANVDSFKNAVLSDIKVNDELFLVNCGKVKVSKVYTFPNKDGLVCDVVVSNGNTEKINYTNPYLFYLPYSKVKDEFAVLNRSLNELALSPYVVNSNSGVSNIHWQEIDEAARYIVVAYRIVKRPGRKRVYHMQDYEIERNTHFIAISDLVGEGIVFKVKAEDRFGKVIAESRCLSSGFETKDME